MDKSIQLLICILLVIVALCLSVFLLNTVVKSNPSSNNTPVNVCKMAGGVYSFRGAYGTGPTCYINSIKHDIFKDNDGVWKLSKPYGIMEEDDYNKYPSETLETLKQMDWESCAI